MVALGVLAALAVGIFVTVLGLGRDGDGWVSPDHSGSLLSAGGGLVCSSESAVWCLDAGTGDERFRVALEGDLSSPPVLLDDRVLVASWRTLGGDLSAFSLDGEELWTRPLDINTQLDMPVVDGVLAAVEQDAVVGVHVADGEEAWRILAPAEGQAGDTGDVVGPHVVGDDVFTDGTRFYAAIGFVNTRSGDADGNIVAIDPASGQELWRSELRDEIGRGAGIADVAPFEDGSAVAFLTAGTEEDPRRIVALDSASGRKLWETSIASDDANIADAGGATIVADGRTTRALGRDGRVLWEVPSPASTRSPSGDPGELVSERGRLFVAGFDVFEVDPATGESEPLRADVQASDVAVTSDLLVIMGISQLEAIPLPPSSAAGDGE